MTSKERITNALEGRDVDHVPFCPFLAYVWENFPLEIQDMGQLAFHHMVGADPMWRGAPCPVRAETPEIDLRVFEENGRTVTVTSTPVGQIRYAQMPSSSGKTLFLVEHPLKTEDDFKTWLWIEEHTRFTLDISPVHQHLQGEGREGLSIGLLLPRAKSAFQTMVEHLVGTEELIYALTDYPGTVEELWRVMVKKNLEAVYLAAAIDEYDYFLSWEDSSTTNYSPALYDRYIGSEIGKWCEILSCNNKRYIQHACGHIKALVGRMQAHGVFAVESISPPPTGNINIRDARVIIEKGMGIIGGIEPTQFLNLSKIELAPYVEQVIADGAGGPFVLANSDSCPPGVSVEKFKIASDVAKGAHP